MNRRSTIVDQSTLNGSRDALSDTAPASSPGLDLRRSSDRNLRPGWHGLFAIAGVADRAFRNRELELHYQPEVSLETGNPCGLQALVHWRRGNVLISPEDFLPAAGRGPIAGPLTDLMVDEACAEAGKWHRGGLAIQVAVSLTHVDLHDESLPGRIEGALARHGVPAGFIRLELTDATLLEEPERSRVALERITALGVSVSVETGSSSLLWLEPFPVSTIKVGRALIAEVTGERRANLAELVRLAHDLELTVVADGVEDEQQLRILQELECDLVRGHLFSAPLPAGEVERWLAGQPPGAWIRPTAELQLASCELSVLEDARNLIDAAAGELNLSPEDIWDVKLAATEALANAIEHGNGHSDRIQMRLAQEGDELAVYVSNCGTFRQVLPSSAMGGRGLAVMTLVMDRVELRRDADDLHMRLVKRLEPAKNAL